MPWHGPDHLGLRAGNARTAYVLHYGRLDHSEGAFVDDRNGQSTRWPTRQHMDYHAMAWP